MSLENAKSNLEEFGKELNLQVVFDENNTCILGIDNAFSLHLTYEPNSDRLYIYAPLLDGLPKDTDKKLSLYQALLVGVAVKEELILMHCVVEMGIGTDSSALRRFAPLFVESVEKWRERIEKLLDGKDDANITSPMNRINKQAGQKNFSNSSAKGETPNPFRGKV